MLSCEKGPAEGSSTTIAIAVASITGDNTTSASADKTTSCVRRPTQYNRCSRRFCFRSMTTGFSISTTLADIPHTSLTIRCFALPHRSSLPAKIARLPHKRSFSSMTTTRAFMDTSEIPFLRYFDQRHFRFNVSFQQCFWNRDFFFHLSVSHNFNRLLHALCKSQTLLFWDFILFLSFFWAFFFQSHNPCLFSYYDLFLDQFYHNFTITSIVFHSNIYPFYSRRFITLFALFYFCSTKLNRYKWFFEQLLPSSHRLSLQ